MGAATSCLRRCSSDAEPAAVVANLSPADKLPSGTPSAEAPDGSTAQADPGPSVPSPQGEPTEGRGTLDPGLARDGSSLSSAGNVVPAPVPGSTVAAGEGLGQGSEPGAVPPAVAMEVLRFVKQEEESRPRRGAAGGADPSAVTGSSAAPEASPSAPGEGYTFAGAEKRQLETGKPLADQAAMRDYIAGGGAPSGRYLSCFDIVRFFMP